MRTKGDFKIFKGLSMKQIHNFLREGESPTLTGSKKQEIKIFNGIYYRFNPRANTKFVVFKLLLMVKYAFLKPVSTIFINFLFFSPNDRPLKTMKFFLFHLKSSFHSQDIQIFVIFSLPFHTFQIQKDKWKWNNL